MNHLRRFILICIITFLFSHIALFAESKEYAIKSAYFNVQLLENGDATVTETWIIDFTKGSFTRFYVERYLDVPKLEKFSDIVYHSFTINDVECTPNHSKDRTPGTYSIKADNRYETYAWYMNAENEEMVFSVQYTLKDIVKYTEDDTALFCYRFVGENFQKNIEYLNIGIYAPSECAIEVRSGNHYRHFAESGSINFFAGNIRGLVKINVAMPKDVFSDTISFISDNELKEVSIDISALIFWIFIFCLIGWGIGYSNKKFPSTKSINRKLKKAAKDPVKIKLIIDKFMQLDITPIEYNRILGEPFTQMNAFRLVFLELIRKAVISIDKDSLYIDVTKLDDLKEYEREFIQGLFSHMPFSSENEKRGILLADFFKDFTLSYKQLSRLMSTVRKMLKVSKEHKALKEDAAILRAYLIRNSKMYSLSIYDIFQYYKRNHTIGLEALYYLASHTPITHSKVSTRFFKDARNRVLDLDGFYREISYILDTFAAKYDQPKPKWKFSVSGGSSCSSYSSCSSCGGGGAD